MERKGEKGEGMEGTAPQIFLPSTAPVCCGFVVQRSDTTTVGCRQGGSGPRSLTLSLIPGKLFSTSSGSWSDFN